MEHGARYPGGPDRLNFQPGEGRIRVDDSSWRVTGADRFAGAKVRVVRIEGSTLVVDDP